MLSADQLLAVLWKRRWTFLLTFALVVAGASAVIFTSQKVYRTSSYLLVSAKLTSGSDFEATQTTQVLTKTFAELMQTRTLADEVAERLPFETSGQALGKSVEIEPISQSQLIAITAEESSPERAKLVADTYAEAFVARAKRLSELGSAAASVSLAEPAAIISNPARPRPKLYLAIASLLAAFVAAAVAFLRQRFDQRLEVDGATIELFGLPILGRIPSRKTDDIRNDPHLADAFRLVLANLTFANLGRRPRSLAVVSAGEGEGKSTTAVSIARAATELGAKVLLVDGDLRRPGLTSMMKTELPSTGPGFSSLLLNPERLGASLESGNDGLLQFVAAGPIPPNPAALLGSSGLTRFEAEAKELVELVVLDTPPLLVGADASLISAHAEGVILVVDASKTKRAALLQAIEQLRRAQSNVLGVILNKMPESGASYYYSSDEAGPSEEAEESFSGRGKSEPLRT